MKKLILFFALLLSVSSSFISCRDTERKDDDTELSEDIDEMGDEMEEKAEDIEDEMDDDM